MTISTIDYTEDFARFWRMQMGSMNCPPLPKSVDDLPLSAQLALADWNDGRLYQNLFGRNGSERLPADVVVRRNAGQNIPQDAEPLRNAGLEYEARQAELRGERLDDLQLSQEAETSRKAFIESQRQLAQWQNMPLAARMTSSPLNERVSAQARREWGINETP